MNKIANQMVEHTAISQKERRAINSKEERRHEYRNEKKQYWKKYQREKIWRLGAAERERKKQQRRNREGIFTNIDIPAEGRKSDGVHHWENNTGVVWNYKAFLLVARYHLEGEVVEEEEESGGKYVLSERRRRRKKKKKKKEK